jgi:hypothetical protein
MSFLGSIRTISNFLDKLYVNLLNSWYFIMFECSVGTQKQSSRDTNRIAIFLHFHSCHVCLGFSTFLWNRIVGPVRHVTIGSVDSSFIISFLTTSFPTTSYVTLGCGQPCLITVWYICPYTCPWQQQVSVIIKHWWWWPNVIKDYVHHMIFLYCITFPLPL